MQSFGISYNSHLHRFSNMKFLFDLSPLAVSLLLSLKSAAAKKENSKGRDSPSCEGSTPGWVDVDGMGCGWYERNEAPGCPIWGDYTGYDIVTRVKFPDINRVGVANNNCCHCQGTAVRELSLKGSILFSLFTMTR